ncbi:MAG: D-tyrosyl-tRNA(Tyr) deacylase [Firmicutes bacterium]|nr:D-tyrosyl-tRNA(Tyr) deacylase [Bacillota bacterium]
MRAVIQRVLRGKVSVEAETIGEIGPGLVVLLGVGIGDGEEDACYLAEKIINLRIFNDDDGKLNCSLKDLQLPMLVVSQFTLYGDCRKGRRPSFSQAAPWEIGEKLYETFCREVENYQLRVAKGRFRSQMVVEIINDGPVTIMVDSKRLF